MRILSWQESADWFAEDTDVVLACVKIIIRISSHAAGAIVLNIMALRYVAPGAIRNILRI